MLATLLLIPVTQFKPVSATKQVKYIELRPTVLLAVKQPTFPDRTAAYNEMKAQEAVEAAQAAEAAQLATQTVYVAPAPPTDGYKAFIYDHESGNDPTRWNGSGCLGLGQACPASKLLAVCPTMGYDCEDAFFTDYMLHRYGSWQAAYNFWIRTDCRPYCGNWW